jgi:hypothetical protein
MKNAFLIAAIFLLGACKPFPAEAEKAPAPSTQAQQESSVEAQAGQTDAPPKKEDKPVIDEEIAPNNLVISKSTTTDNYQSIKRVNYPDASCWVVINTKTWDSSISCLPKSQLPKTESP